MQKIWLVGLVRGFAAVAMVAFIANCGKSGGSGGNGANNGTYVTCPSTGYVTNAYGSATQCAPGTTVFTGYTNAGGQGYSNCPQTGFYQQNGMTYTCSPGSNQNMYGNANMYNGGINSAGGSNPCAQYYGPQFVPAVMNGQLVCVSSGGYSNGYY